jgi:carboxypeptidase Taq
MPLQVWDDGSSVDCDATTADANAKRVAITASLNHKFFGEGLQKALSLQIMDQLGFDFDHGRLDKSAHPFSGGVPTDSRITTRYDEADFTSALMGVIHETGHANYEQGLPSEWSGLPCGTARSMGIHESQSLFFELQLARNQRFVETIVSPLAVAAFITDNPNLEGKRGERKGAQADIPARFTIEDVANDERLQIALVKRLLSPDNLTRVLLHVDGNNLIRVNADEVTYPAHVILRYEIERDLVEGLCEVEDIPRLWDAKMQEYFHIATAENFQNGCMQDIHWPLGAFGYFPTYTLGAMYAAQFRAAMSGNTAEPVACNVLKDNSLEAQIETRNLTAITAWLDEHVWKKASTKSVAEILREATGEDLNPVYFKRHLETRYLSGKAGGGIALDGTNDTRSKY